MKKQKGFTLIEVLISMMVLAVGLLGLAALQATGLRNNLSAYHRSQATQLAYDIADRMRTNVGEAGTYAASVYITTVPTAAAVQNTCKLVAGTCTPAQMAQNDLFEWNRSIAGGPAVGGPPALVAETETLPLGMGLISIEAGTTNIYQISIAWDDNRDGTRDANFLMRFQI